MQTSILAVSGATYIRDNQLASYLRSSLGARAIAVKYKLHV